MARSFFTATFLHTDGSLVVSRTFATKRAGRKFLAWLLTRAYVAEATLYQGAPGEFVVERVAR